ncbi:MAG: hypothetical protein HY763_17125, partial [Planctomycetes bacterium]|nr:hypothetical protein [Planctomycetota bacterium]
MGTRELFSVRGRIAPSVFSVVGLFVLAVGVRASDEVVAGAGSTLDYPAFHDCLDGPSAPVAAGCSSSDFHPDGHVDLRDFAVLQRSYQTLSLSSIQPGAEAVGEIAPIGDIDVFTFFASQGAFVTVDYFTPMVGGLPDHFARLDLIRPDGAIASTNALCGNFRLDNVAVNQSGTWTVRVRTHESWANCGYGAVSALQTGLYTLTVCLSSTPAIPISYGQTIASAFAVDCQIVNFSFTGSSGDVVSAFYAGPTSTRRLRLFDPAGVEIGSSASGVTVGIFDEVLLANGTYRLWAEALDNDAVGAFGISLTELDGAVPIAFNTPVNTSISQTAEVDLYAFN